MNSMLFAPNDLFLSLEREKGQWREYAGKRPVTGHFPAFFLTGYLNAISSR